MRLPAFEYYAPKTLGELIKIKGELGLAAHMLAGGTDLLPRLKQRVIAPSALISVKDIPELQEISYTPTTIKISSAARLNSVATDPEVLRHFPILSHAIKAIGAVSIQHFRGTIGGNLCLSPRCNYYNQSHFWRMGKGLCNRTGGNQCHALKDTETCQAVCSQDTAPALVALGAEIDLAGGSGARSVLARDFFTGKGESPFNLGPDEILTSIRIPIPWSETSSSYQRLAYRSAVDFPMVNSACVAIIENNKVESFKMAVSALGPAPVALTELEKVVRGNEPDPEMASMAEEVAGRIAESTVVENSVSPKDYRIGAASVMAGRAVRAALKLPDKNS